MARKIINLGSGESTADGESIRSALGKCNDNFAELYADDSTVDGRLDTLEALTHLELTDFSVTTAAASGAGSLAYDNTTGVFTFTPVATVAETNDLSASVTWTNIPDAYVPASAVTQHQAALTITQSQISDLAHFDGAYSSLTGAPTIPADVSDLTDTTNLLTHFDGAYSSLTGAPTAVSAFTNDSGYLTSVSEAAVTAHEAALTITESQISDLQSYLTSETTTTLALTGNSLDFTDETGTVTSIDLSAYLDEDSRAITSGTLNPSTGIVTYTRDDASTFTLDLSALLDDGPVASVAGQTGVVTLDTDDVSEGTNLYYTDTRSRGAVSVTTGSKSGSGALSYNSSTGVLTYSPAQLGNYSFSSNAITSSSGAAAIDLKISGADANDPPAFVQRQWSFDTDGSIKFVDPTALPPSTLATITATKVGQWDTAYGWGDHSAAGYLTSVTDQWTETGSNIYYNSGNVSIGTSTVAYPLTVAGSTDVLTRFDGSAKAATGTVEIDILGPQSNGDIQMGIGGSSVNDAANNISNKGFVASGVGLAGLNLRADNGFVQITVGGITAADEVARFTSSGATITGTLNSHTIPGGTGTLALTSDIPANAVESDTSGITGADQVTNIVTLTQAEYDAIGTPNASTVYIIVG